MGDVVRLAMEHPEEYAHYLHEAHPVIAAFGGIFLLMIFIEFILDYGRQVHWIRAIEQPLMNIGRLKQFPPFLAMSILVLVAEFLGGEHKFDVLMAGSLGLILYLGIRSLTEVFDHYIDDAQVSGAFWRLYDRGRKIMLYGGLFIAFAVIWFVTLFMPGNSTIAILAAGLIAAALFVIPVFLIGIFIYRTKIKKEKQMS